MKIRILGARGSHPTSNRENEYYGGDTSCVAVMNGNEHLFLDAGTGILTVNWEELNNYPRFDILLTHLHMDHIQGLGFFKPLFNCEKEVHIWGPGESADSLRSRLDRFLSPPLFPVTLRDTECQLSIHAIDRSSFQIGNFLIQSKFVSHPGPTLGFRIQTNSRTLAYIPDHEPVIGKADLIDGNSWLSGFEVAQGADLLIHDAQFGLPEYMTKIGWGHCSMHHAAEFSLRTQVKHLIMFHHDPAHTDTIKNHMFREFQSNNDYPFKMDLAVQGSEMVI